MKSLGSLPLNPDAIVRPYVTEELEKFYVIFFFFLRLGNAFNTEGSGVEVLD